MYFKAILEVTNYKNQKDERILHLQANNIIHAMDITRKIRGAQFKVIVPQTKEEYYAGVDLKYKN